MRDLEARDFEAAAAFNARAEREGWQQQCDPALNFRHPDQTAALKLWDAQTHGRSMPARRDMTARLLKPFLARIALQERVATNPSRWRWRLMGTQITQIIGERTGRFFDENAPSKQSARWTASCDLVLQTARPVRFVGRVIVNDKNYLYSELLFMPLADDNGTPRFVLGFGSYTGDKPIDFRLGQVLLGN